MDGEQAKKVVIVHDFPDLEYAHQMKLLLDGISGRQGIWQVAEAVQLQPITKKAAAGLLGADEPYLVLLCGRRVATAFGFRSAPWFDLRVAGRNVYAVVPHPSRASRWWPRKNNAKLARDFFLRVIDHFSRRFGQPPGSVSDIAPTVELYARGKRVLRNTSADRPFFFVLDGRRIRVAPGREKEFWFGDDALAVTWEARLCAPSVELHVIREAGEGKTVRDLHRTRGLTAHELDKMCSEPVHHVSGGAHAVA